MCSRPGGKLAALALGLAAILALAAGCGHKDNPQPPPQRIPAQIPDLSVSQRGTELRVSFTFPQVTISGRPIDVVAAIEIWEYEVPVPEFVLEGEGEDEGEDEGEGEGDTEEGEETDAPEEEGDAGDGEPAQESESEAGGEAEAEGDAEETDTPEEPTEELGAPDEAAPTDEPAETPDETPADEGGDGEDGGEEDDDDAVAPPAASKETLLLVDPREFAGASQLRLLLEGEELSKAIRGGKVELTLPLDRIEPGETTALVFGVKSFQSLKRASPFSNLATIIPRITPEPPADLELEPVPNGIKLSWTFEGDEPLEFRFYRRDKLNPIFGTHLGFQAGDSDQFLDASAELGGEYEYAMTVVVNTVPLVESALSSTRKLTYVDAFPPSAPTDLVVLSEVGIARLLWDGSEDEDVAGYAVYRRAAGGDFERLNAELVGANEYVDSGAASGRTYAYRVVAVDRTGNMGEPSEEVEAVIP